MKNKGFIFFMGLSLVVCLGVSCSRQVAKNHKFALYADTLLDSTFKYYKVDNTNLFNENYPKKEGETVSYLAGADSVRKNKVAYLWPTSGLFSGINALLKATGDKKYKDILETILLPGLQCYYDTTRTPYCYQSYLAEAGQSDRFYDDNIWLGLDFLESYELTGNALYLASSEAIWHFLESGRDSILGDGIYWCEQKKFSKNTCSNAPASVLALKLYTVTGNAVYLKVGKELYHWTKDNLQDPSDELYFDNIMPDGKVDKTKFQYNSGQMLQAAALLYKITGEPQYLEAAQKLAQACSDYFFIECKVDGNTFRTLKNGNIWFVAIMLRGFEELYHVDKNPQYLNNFMATLEYMWNHNRNVNKLFEDERFIVNTSNVKDHKWLLTQAAMIEMYARLSILK